MFREKNIADWKLVWGFMTTCPLPVFSRKAIFFSRSDFSAGSIPPISLIWLLGWGVLSRLEKLVNLGYNVNVQKISSEWVGVATCPSSFCGLELSTIGTIKYGIR